MQLQALLLSLSKQATKAMKIVKHIRSKYKSKMYIYTVHTVLRKTLVQRIRWWQTNTAVLCKLEIL